MNKKTRFIFVKYITLRNGKRIYASDYGYKAFRIPVTAYGGGHRPVLRSKTSAMRSERPPVNNLFPSD